MESLRESGGDIRTVVPENLHVTLKFLGEVREDHVKKLSSTLEEFARDHEPFTAGFSVLGCFGSPRFPSVVWVGISEGRDIITGMADDLNTRLSWIRKDDRKPRPHLTLARVISPRNSDKLVERVQSLRHVKLGEVAVREIILKKSMLMPDGPVYSDLDRFALGRAGT